MSSGRIDDIAVIDVGGTSSSAASSAGALPLAEVGDACRHPGFFFLANHGISPDRIEATFEEARRFYTLPAEAKSVLKCGPASQFLGYRALGAERSRLHPGGEACEQYRLGNIVPSPAMGELLDRYNGPFPESVSLFHELVGFSDTLMAISGTALELPTSFLAALKNAPMHRLGLNYYALGAVETLRNHVAYSMTPHVDHAILTIVVQDEPGLQVLDSGDEWIEVPIVDGALFCFVGDYYQRWTNGIYRAVRHRVREVDRDRFSIQYKHKPPHGAIVTPLETFVTADNAQHYDAFETGEQYFVLLQDLLARPGSS